MIIHVILQDSYKIKYLSGRFIIYEDGRVDQYKSWTISCVGLSCIVITDEVNGPLISAEPVQVLTVYLFDFIYYFFFVF